MLRIVRRLDLVICMKAICDQIRSDVSVSISEASLGGSFSLYI